MRSDRLLAFGAVAALVLFLLSLIEVSDARLQTGDVYPFESIGRLKAMKVGRRFDPIQEFGGSDTTIFVFGVPSGLLEHSAAAVAQFEQTASRANRVAVSLPVCSVTEQKKNPVFVMNHGRWRGNA